MGHSIITIFTNGMGHYWQSLFFCMGFNTLLGNVLKDEWTNDDDRLWGCYVLFL